MKNKNKWPIYKKKTVHVHQECVHLYSIVKDNQGLRDMFNRLSEISSSHPMGTNCALLLADLFLHKYEAEFIQIPAI